MPRDVSANLPDAAVPPRCVVPVVQVCCRARDAGLAVERRIDVTPAAVADTGVKLKSLVTAAGDR
ncbi:hypothetical protein [Burkholderia catarinensis]|uniref:hypothetical protein n=1 Tax=Burkholderia catarinensis TaxID=1108140 RepID=UPI001008133A|nr:hypothetical protein [Burkholderia catarinensis]